MLFFKKKKESKEPENHVKPFVSFVLLEEANFSPEKLIHDLKADWGIKISKKDLKSSDEPFVSSVDGMNIAVTLMPAQIPNDEAIENAKTNFRWREAVEVAQKHTAHLLVAVLPGGKSATEAGTLMVKLCTSCLKQEKATAINTLGSVLEPEFYTDCAEAYLADGSFPIMNLVFFGVYTTDNGQTFCGYTYGMDAFEKEELEVVNSTHSPDEIIELLSGISSYIILQDVLLQDGETIGFTADQKLSITHSAGVAVQGNSLKIGF